MTAPSANNFDLIRLVAALQVAFHHSLVHLEIDFHGSWLLSVTSLFPRRNDMSYGVYIYHMPVVNILVSMSIVGTFPALFVSLTATILLAFASWHLVEKPSLRFKRHPLYQHYAPVGEDGHGVRTRTDTGSRG